MKIAIVGSSGQVGGDLVKFFSNTKYDVFSVSRKNKKKIFKKNKQREINIDEFELLKNCEVVINCVANHYFSENQNYSNYYESNVLFLKKLVQISSQVNCKLFINLSSVSLYEQKFGNKRINEKNKINKNDFYCKTKIIGEDLLKKSKLNFLNLRLPGILCSNFNRHSPWIKKIYDDLKKNKTIEIYNSNYLYNSVIDTHEIFRVVKKLIIKKNKVYRNTYNLVGNNFLTIMQLINFLKKKSTSKSKIILSKYKKKNSSFICNKKISKTLPIKLASVKKIIYRNF
jgi:dTDP-4-dehydrorhamnose reductase